MGTSQSRDLYPPGPWNPLTIYSIAASPAEVLTNLAGQYGPVFSFRLLGPLTVVLNNNDVIRQGLFENADAFPNRQTSPLRKSWGIRGRLFYSVGEDQTQIRAFVVKGLHDFQKQYLLESVSREARHICAAFANEIDKPFDPTEYISLATANIMAIVNFGKRFKYDDLKFKKLIEALDYLFYALQPSNPVHQYPWLYDTFIYRRMKNSQEFVKDFVKEEIQQHKISLDSSKPRDFIDLYLLKVDKEDTEEEPLFYVTRAWYTIKDIFSSSSNPSSAAIQWLLALMCKYQEEQDKVYQEIQSCIGISRLPVYEDMKSMPYTHAFIQEALRFRPAVPFGTRETARDVTVGGYTIPKGSNVLINYWAAEQDPDVWDQPQVFNPERFLEIDGTTPKKPNHHIPLGVGHRNCLGQTLAMAQMFLVITNLLQQFKLQFSPSDPLPAMKGICGATVVVEKFQLSLTNRH